MGGVTVYSKRGCVQCDATIRRLKQRNIPHTIISLDDDPDALVTVKQLGFLQAPVIVAGAVSWAGYQPNRIDNLVKETV